MVGNGAIDLYWGRNGRIWCCIFLLGTMQQRMTRYISTGDAVVGYGAVYLFLRRCGRLPHCRALLGTIQ